MRVDVFTLFPAMFQSPFAESIMQRAMTRSLLELCVHNIRDYTTDRHHVCDDMAYGGGGGMVMKPEPIFTAVESVLKIGAVTGAHGAPAKPMPIILMSPAGRKFSHEIAVELATHARFALVCGHYEGVDERVREHLCTDAISIGDYVLTGGELPAMVIVDAVARQLPDVLPEFAPRVESHADGNLEYPHYTRPAVFRGWAVPDVLLSGNHAVIEKWRKAQSAMRTAMPRG